MHTRWRISALLTGIGSLLLANPARATLYYLDVNGVPGIATGSCLVVIDATNNNTDLQVVSIHQWWT